jgi:Ni,Fe-hydrogenase I small subunit
VKLAALRPPEGYGDVLSYGIIVHEMCNRRKHFRYERTCLTASDCVPPTASWGGHQITCKRVVPSRVAPKSVQCVAKRP